MQGPSIPTLSRLDEVNIKLHGAFPKSLVEDVVHDAEIVVMLGGDPIDPLLKGKNVIKWERVPNAKGKSLDA